MIKINDYISKIECSDHPLSADVYIIKGDKHTYIVDVGHSEEALETLKSIPNKKIIITHFHADHMGNLKALAPNDNDLYVGDYTAKYYGGGTVIKEPIHLEDGVIIDIFPLPSSHAKGCLTIAVNKNCILLGDGCYSNIKGYNVSVTFDMIKTLKNIEFSTAIKSHDDTLYTKDELITELETIYSQKEKDKPYIDLSLL
ncbi:MAG: MBL fold metallo-hydrolase [Lachnospiraceae bacterium]|nr:MBL fold metallo-hydrolase [Lachnospiraceae bacterium]